MFGYILIVVITACGGSSCHIQWDQVTMQRFDDAKACQFASLELIRRSSGVRAVCVPEATPKK